MIRRLLAGWLAEWTEDADEIATIVGSRRASHCDAGADSRDDIRPSRVH